MRMGTCEVKSHGLIPLPTCSYNREWTGLRSEATTRHARIDTKGPVFAQSYGPARANLTRATGRTETDFGLKQGRLLFQFLPSE